MSNPRTRGPRRTLAALAVAIVVLFGGIAAAATWASAQWTPKLGLDLTAWMAIAFVCVTVFLVGFRILAIVSFPMMAGGAWLIVRKHPKMFQLWGLSLNQKSYYDPRKQ